MKENYLNVTITAKPIGDWLPQCSFIDAIEMLKVYTEFIKLINNLPRLVPDLTETDSDVFIKINHKQSDTHGSTLAASFVLELQFNLTGVDKLNTPVPFNFGGVEFNGESTIASLQSSIAYLLTHAPVADIEYIVINW